jgi:hypothetical protein
MDNFRRGRLRKRIRTAAAHLDDVELDRAFEYALQGDMEQVERVLSRTNGDGLRTRDFSWRETSSWLFNRTAFPKKD